MDEELEEIEELEKPQKPKKTPGFGLGIALGALITATAALIVILILFHTGALSGKSSNAAAPGISEQIAEKIEAIEGLIELHYFGDIDRSQEEEGLYKGLVESLEDPYSEYFTADEYEDQLQTVTKQYYGIGATLTQDADTMEVSIVYVYEDTPAERAGLKVGDKIISADGYEATSMDLDSFVDKIRGEEGTDVTMVIEREGEKEPLTFTVTREEVNLPTVDYDMVSDDVGFIYITRFAVNTPEEFREAVEDLTGQGMKALIIDVRYNPGGIYSSVVDILDQILPEGIVVYTEDKYGNRQEETSDAEHKLSIPIAVLISENSASASEILAGAIRDYDYGTLIGTTTYGKGVVQKTYEMTDGSAVKLTIEKYFTPNGENIDGVGIDPDIELEYEFLGNEDDDYSYELDNQLQKAIEVLEKEL